jgi:hypothetical protein
MFGTGWRPIFLVNVPAGLAVLACAAGRLPAGPRLGEARLGEARLGEARLGNARLGNAERTYARLDLAGAAWLAAAIVALTVPLTFGADAGWPAWSWPALAAGAAGLVVFARHEKKLARAGREPLVDPALLARPGVRSTLTGIFTLHASYGGLLFTSALYLQHALHESALRSGVTFAGYAAGFAVASVTWTRLPAAWQSRLPQAAFAVFAAATGTLAWLLGTATWPWQATAVLVVAGAAHGTGFDTLVHRTAAGLPAGLAASFSGVLATINQLAIVTGIAVAGTLYLSAAGSTTLSPMSVVMFALAAALTVTGAGVAAAIARSGG